MALYGTDVLIIVLLALWVARSVRAGFKLVLKQSDYILAVFLLLAAFSIVHSSNKAVGVYQLVKLAEFAALFLYLRSDGLRLMGISRMAWALVAGGLAQSAVAVGQYIRQADLGLRFLGETLLAPQMQGVASFYLENGEKIMRAYGTTPHPNVLAGYLFLSLVALFWLFWRTGKRILVAAVYPVILFGFLLTFSRTIIAVWLAAIVVWAFLALFVPARAGLPTHAGRRDSSRAVIRMLAVTTAVFSALFVFMFWPQVKSRILISTADEAFSQRIYYSSQALRSGGGLNWSGVGLGGFTDWLRKHQPNLSSGLYQPVHNIYLLIYAETGILGIAAFILFLILLLLRCRNIPVLILTFSVLAIGLFDHFLWTLQQGRIILWSVLALAGAYTTIGLHGRAGSAG